MTYQSNASYINKRNEYNTMKTIISATLTIALSAAMGMMLLDSALSSIEAREQAVTAAYVDAGIQWAQENKQ